MQVRPFVNFMASGLIRVQLLFVVQNRSFCCLILQIGVSYHVIAMCYLNYEHTVCNANSFTIYSTLLFFSLFSYSG